MLYIGVTGTQNVPNREQALRIVTSALYPYVGQGHVGLNGVCIGMDEVISSVFYLLHMSQWAIIPANRSKIMPFESIYERFNGWYTMPAGTSYMDRNDEIIRRADILLGFPATNREELRSGTWATIRRGWRKQIPVFVHPIDGSIYIRS